MFLNEKLVILYGSQTGNAQDLAERIWRESKRFYFRTSVKSMDEYNILELTGEQCVIFVCSTTGQGEEPDNMRNFWKFLLKKSLPRNSLINLKYAVLGLGDSSYQKFNFTAKKLNKRLKQLGGDEIIPLGLGDDQHDLGYDAVSDPWIDSLYDQLVRIYPLPLNVKAIERRNNHFSPRFTIVLPKLLKSIDPKRSIYDSIRKPNEFSSTVISNIRTTHLNHFQDVRLISLSIEDIDKCYEPGDVLVLRPKNLPWQIDELRRVLKENNVKIIGGHVKAVALSKDLPFPEPLNQVVLVEKLYEEYFDLMAVPRRRTFEILAELTDSELERDKCLEFTRADGQQELYTYCNRPKRNIVEVLADFPHATKNLNLELLFELLPQIKAREFSIASNWKMHKNKVDILVAVVKYKTKGLKKERFGLCSNFLADLKEGDKVTVGLKKGTFRFPSSPNVPVIMVGAGTGFAPFRNFIFERVNDDTANSQSLALFFGCRHQEMDFHCKDELIELVQLNKLSLFTAFSRQYDQKVYVQDKIMENSRFVWDLLMDRNGCIFIAGSAKLMPQQVRQSFIKVVMNEGGFNENEAEKFLINLEKTNRYQTECWS